MAIIRSLGVHNDLFTQFPADADEHWRGLLREEALAIVGEKHDIGLLYHAPRDVGDARHLICQDGHGFFAVDARQMAAGSNETHFDNSRKTSWTEEHRLCATFLEHLFHAITVRIPSHQTDHRDTAPQGTQVGYYIARAA